MTHHHDHLDSDLQPLSDDLDRLGCIERAGTPQHLEVSLLAAVEREVLNATPLPLAGPDSWFRSPVLLAAAASIALLMGLTFLFWQTAPHLPTPQPIAQSNPVDDVEEFIATVAWLGAELPDFSELNRAAQQIPRLDDEAWNNPEETLLDVEESI